MKNKTKTNDVVNPQNIEVKKEKKRLDPIDHEKMICEEVKDQNNNEKYLELMKDKNSKYYELNKLFEEWKNGKKINEFNFFEVVDTTGTFLSPEVTIFLFRLMKKHDVKRFTNEIYLKRNEFIKKYSKYILDYS